MDGDTEAPPYIAPLACKSEPARKSGRPMKKRQQCYAFPLSTAVHPSLA